MYDGWPSYDGSPVQMSTLFPSCQSSCPDALHHSPPLHKMRLLVSNPFYPAHQSVSDIPDIHLTPAPETLSVSQPILLSLSPLLLAAPAPQIIAGAPGIPVNLSQLQNMCIPNPNNPKPATQPQPQSSISFSRFLCLPVLAWEPGWPSAVWGPPLALQVPGRR